MKVKMWGAVIICVFFLICMSGCHRNENATINQDSNVENSVIEQEVLFEDELCDIIVYGIAESNTESIRIVHEEETIDIKGAFSNIYEETPQVCVKDIDNDQVDEIILSCRRYTGTKRTYDFYICDKTDSWNVVTYENLYVDVADNISYQYVAEENQIVFYESKGEQIEVILPDWSAEYPYAGEVSFTDDYFYDVSAMTLEVIPEIKMTNSLPYKPLSILFDVQYVDGAVTIIFNHFSLQTNEMSGEDLQSELQEQPCITSITQISDDEMEVTFSYELDSEIKTHSFISQSYPDLCMEPQDRAHVELIDIDTDGTPEVVCKVYYIGNTFTEFCGDLHVFRITEEGLEHILSMGTEWEIPDERWITASYSDVESLYVETGTKRWEDGELYTDPVVYKLECQDGNWVTVECELPEEDLAVW